MDAWPAGAIGPVPLEALGERYRRYRLASAEGRRREEREHRPAHDRNEQREAIRQRFDELGPAAARFWEGLAKTHRFAKEQCRRVLALLANYHAEDLQAVLERAVRFGAFTLAAVERILAAQARPKSLFDLLADEQHDHLQPLLGSDPVGPLPTSDYQHLLFEEPADNDPPHETGVDSPEEAPCPTARRSQNPGSAVGGGNARRTSLSRRQATALSLGTIRRRRWRTGQPSPATRHRTPHPRGQVPRRAIARRLRLPGRVRATTLADGFRSWPLGPA